MGASRKDAVVLMPALASEPLAVCISFVRVNPVVVHVTRTVGRDGRAILEGARGSMGDGYVRPGRGASGGDEVGVSLLS